MVVRRAPSLKKMGRPKFEMIPPWESTFPVHDGYSWIGHGLQSGPTLAFSLWLSDFKTKTIFGFLIKKTVFLFFQKVEK